MTDQNYNLTKCEAGYAVYPLFELETHSAFLKLYNKMVKYIKLNQNKTLTSSIKYYMERFNFVNISSFSLQVSCKLPLRYELLFVLDCSILILYVNKHIY